MPTSAAWPRRPSPISTRHRDTGTDFLAVSFSTLDTVGHAYGPRSHEVQDVLVRLDETIGTLLAELDRQVGRDSYALALTADHGVSPIPQQMQALGLGGGLVDRKAVTTVLTGALGGSVLDSNTGSEIYLSKDAAAKLAALDQHEWDARPDVARAGRRHRPRLAHHATCSRAGTKPPPTRWRTRPG